MNNTIDVVFIHGAGLGSYIWNKVLRHIQLPAIATDIPETNNTVSRETLSLNEYSRIIMEKIKSFNKKKIILIAHSRGGISVLALTRYFKIQIIGLIGKVAVFPKSGQSFIISHPLPVNIIFPVLLRLFGTHPTNKAISNNLCTNLLV